MTSRVQYTVLGPLGCAIDGRPQALGGLKQRAIFAALVLARGRTVSTEGLGDAAWNGEPPPNYPATVQVFVAGLRKMFRDAGLDPKAQLVTAPPGYRLTIADDALDLSRFDSAVRAGRNAMQSGHNDDAARAFRFALAQFSGEVLHDLRGLTFADDFVVALDRHRLDATTAWTAAEIACGRAESVITELVALARAHPLDEPLSAQLSTALYVSGRQSDALDECRRLRDTLADELGIDPSPDVQDLEARILRQERLIAAPSAAAMAATMTEDEHDIGHGQLRDSAGRTHPIPSGGLHIGRMPDNEIVVDSPKVSRYHAVVSGSAAGFAIRDLRSSNGTRVNDARIADHTTLVDGDRIGIGPATFTFESEG